jgi:hypothetical protein
MMADELVAVGCQVELELVDRAGMKEHMQVVIVPDDAADFSQGYLSVLTPIAKAILGERAGSVIPYLKDDILSIEIITVTKSSQPLSSDVAEKRKAQRLKTIREVENTSAVVFASSFSGKWGDYDPDSIPKEEASDVTSKDGENNQPA